jgi:transposase
MTPTTLPRSGKQSRVPRCASSPSSSRYPSNSDRASRAKRICGRTDENDRPRSGPAVPVWHRAAPQSGHRAPQCAPACEQLPAWAGSAVGDLLDHFQHSTNASPKYDPHVQQLAKNDERSQRLMRLAGVGPPTSTAPVVSKGNGHECKNGRQLAAWLGLVPGPHGAGGKTQLARITSAGDRYLRTLLVLGARSLLAHATNRTDRVSRWALALHARVGYGKAVVAIAAENARTAWATLVKAEMFRPLT